MATRQRDLDDAFTYEADEVMEVISSLPQKERKITLYRLNPQGNSAYIDEFFPEEFSQAVIKEKYGGGRYAIHAETVDGIKKMRFVIEGESKIAGAQRTIKKIVNGKAYMISLSEKEIIEKAINNQPIFDESLLNGTEYQGRMVPNTEGAQNMNQILIMQIQRLEARMESLQNANNGGGHSRKDFYEELALMKNLFAPNQSQSDTAQLTAMFTKGLEIAGQAFGGEVPSSNPWMAIIEKSIPIVTQAIAQVVATKQNLIPAQPQQQPQPALENSVKLPSNSISDMLPSVNANPPIVSKLSPLLEKVRPFIPQLMASAAADQDPAPWAEIIAGQVPEGEKNSIIDWLSGESYLRDLMQLEPGIKFQLSWWGDMQNALLEILTGQEPEGGKNGDEIQ